MISERSPNTQEKGIIRGEWRRAEESESDRRVRTISEPRPSPRVSTPAKNGIHRSAQDHDCARGGNTRSKSSRAQDHNESDIGESEKQSEWQSKRFGLKLFVGVAKNKHQLSAIGENFQERTPRGAAESTRAQHGRRNQGPNKHF